MTHTAVGTSPDFSGKLRTWGRLLWLSAIVQWPFYILAVLYAGTTMLMLYHVPSYQQAPLEGLALGMITWSILPGIIAVVVFRLIQYAVAIKPESPLRQGWEDIRTLFAKPAPIVTAIPLVFAMALFNKGMLELKPMIPVLNPFKHDAFFMQLDRTLHFGFDPWQLLQPILGHDIPSFIVCTAYNFWFLALFGTFMWFGFSRQSTALRTQFFLAYMLTWWIGGGLIALAASSAGPVYYSNIGLSPDPYKPLFAFLNDVNTRIPLWSLDTQRMLWDGYIGKGQAIGISAFPSMHNASAALYALAAWRQSRAAGICFTIYAGIILVGSVHLGWHYAVDGYAGILIALFMWWVSGFVARWHAKRPSTQRLNEGLAAL